MPYLLVTTGHGLTARRRRGAVSTCSTWPVSAAIPRQRPALLGGSIGGGRWACWSSAGEPRAGRFFDLFNRGLHGDRQRLYPVRRRHAAGLRARCSCVYGGLLVPDLLAASSQHAARVHPVAGHGLPAGQRPAARLGVAGADPGGASTRSARSRTQTPGVDATVAIAGQSLLLNAFGSNFGSMFVTLKAFDERHDPTTSTTRRSPTSSRGAARGARSPRPASRSSARRRCAAWAGPAASWS